MSVITSLIPNGGENFYAFHNGSTMNTINNVISWSITVANNVTIRYKIGSSGTWHNIATGVSTTIGANQYNWSVSSADYTTILSSDSYEDEMYVDVLDEVDSNNTTSAAVFTMGRVSLTAIGPNNTDNPEKIHNESLVNIRWSESYESGLENVFIEYRYKTTGSYGSWTTLVASTANDGSYLWTPSDDSIPDEATMQLRLSGASGGDHTENIGYSEVSDTATIGYIISHDLGDAPYGTTGNQKFPERKEIHARTAVEKGVLADEALAVSQLEAGEGIVIEQRNADGLDSSGKDRAGGTTDDPFAAWNLIIKQKTYARVARDKHGTYDYLNDGPTAESITAGDYYGNTYYFDIVHSWDLGNALASTHISGQTINSFVLEIEQITSTSDRKAPQYKVVPTWEARDEDTIRVYCTLKGTVNDPTTSAAVDDQVTLTKDKLGFDPGSYVFEWRLREVLA